MPTVYIELQQMLCAAGAALCVAAIVGIVIWAFRKETESLLDDMRRLAA